MNVLHNTQAITPPAKKRRSKKDSSSTPKKSYAVVWSSTRSDVYTNVHRAVSKATETNRSLRIFDSHKDAKDFAKHANAPKLSAVVGAPTVTPRREKTSCKRGTGLKSDDTATTETGDTDKVSTEQLKQLLRKRLMNKSGNKIFFLYRELMDKGIVVVVLDVCRETKIDDGEEQISRSVSTSGIQDRHP